MRIEQALILLYTSNTARFETLADLMLPELITTLLAEEDVVTLPRHHISMGLWSGPSPA